MSGFVPRLALAAGLIALPGPAFAQSVTVALDWTPNTNHVGLYVAQAQGYYQEAGLDVEILPYSDTAAGALIAAGVADFGISGPLGIFSQRARGTDIMGVFAVTQKETGRLVFLDAREDIETPADLDGLTYGGFGTGWEDALLRTIIENDGGQAEFEMVTLGTSAYEALANGAIDFTLEVYTWEGVHAEIEGPAQRGFEYADYGVPDSHTTMLAASERWLETNPETAEAFLLATQRGYGFAMENPAEAADILIAANPETLTNPELVHASMRVLVEDGYLADAQGRVGLMDEAKIQATGEFMHRAGLIVDDTDTPLDPMPDFTTYVTDAFLAR